MEGIELAKHLSFDKLAILFQEVLQENNAASTAAQESLVASAFSEHRIEELSSVEIEQELLDCVTWWSKKHDKQHIPILSIDASIGSPFNHISWLVGLSEKPTTSAVLETPLRDRDGSVLLGVLAIEQYVPHEQLHKLIQHWSSDYDIDRQKAAVFFAHMIHVEFPFQESTDPELATIQAVLSESNYTLAWRALHNPDGTINPDIALAGMLANAEKFLPILIGSVKKNKWAHPEHPIMIALRFEPKIANEIPIELLQNSETRNKWWSLFTCGLLLERR